MVGYRLGIRTLCICFPLGAAIIALGLEIGAAAAQDAQPATDLRAQLRALSEDSGVVIKGLGRIGDATPRVIEGGTLKSRIESLLYGYNYLLIHDSEGRIDEVRILGAGSSRPSRPRRIVVPAERRGAHLQVDAIMSGPRGGWLRRGLIVDTGASAVVLPASMIPALGFVAADLTPGWAETAGGKVSARSGRLTRLTVGQAQARDVAVVFIEDDLLGGAALLGMSFLDRFRVTVDDAANQITLIAK